jgi:hypothetical protein
MKERFGRIFGLTILVLTVLCLLVGCGGGSGGPGPGPGGGGGGGGSNLTISGITGTWAVNAVVGNPSTLMAASSMIAASANGGDDGGIGQIIGGDVDVEWAAAPSAGSYTIILSYGMSYRKATNVNIPGSVPFSAFSTLPSGY